MMTTNYQIVSKNPHNSIISFKSGCVPLLTELARTCLQDSCNVAIYCSQFSEMGLQIAQPKYENSK